MRRRLPLKNIQEARPSRNKANMGDTSNRHRILHRPRAAWQGCIQSSSSSSEDYGQTKSQLAALIEENTRVAKARNPNPNEMPPIEDYDKILNSIIKDHQDTRGSSSTRPS